MGKKLKVDLTGVESYTRCPEGEWLARVKKAEMGEVQGSGDDCIKAQFEVIQGSAKGNTVFETFSLSEKALWKLKSFLEAIGMKASGKLTIDLDKLAGKTCVIDVIHDEYNGTKRAKISSYMKPTDDSEGEDEDDEDIDEDDEEEDETPKKSKKTSKPSKKSKKPEPEDEDDEEEDEEDEEDEDEQPAPKKSSKSAKKPEKKPVKKSKKDDDEDEDDDWEDDDD